PAKGGLRYDQTRIFGFAVGGARRGSGNGLHGVDPVRGDWHRPQRLGSLPAVLPRRKVLRLRSRHGHAAHFGVRDVEPEKNLKLKIVMAGLLERTACAEAIPATHEHDVPAFCTHIEMGCSWVPGTAPSLRSACPGMTSS